MTEKLTVIPRNTWCLVSSQLRVWKSDHWFILICFFFFFKQFLQTQHVIRVLMLLTELAISQIE